MILTFDDAKVVVTQRNDRGRPGVVAVVLVAVPRVQDPHPGRQLRGNINDGLADRNELLSQQRARACRALDRPQPRRLRHREGQQPIDLPAVGNQMQFVDDHLLVVENCGRVGPAVRVDSNDEHLLLLCRASGDATAGRPDERCSPAIAPVSSHAATGSERAA